ncbi:hypothetical protein SLS62_010134 [Diatrype stigma]|uniref:Dynactin subunit 6 n=1 Tax=Diatrype stigma TaxID=117547 RepID=A0AAN9UAK9_9PEZI
MSSSSSKRQSVLPRGAPSGPKAPVNFSSSIIIADSALLAGHHTINVSSESVIHPRARLDSANGRVTIGRRCIVHERTVVGAAPSMTAPNPPPPSVPAVDSLRSGGGGGDGNASASGGVMIHDYATIEVNAVIESGGTVIGEGSLVGVGCKIGKGAKIGKHCTLTPQTIIQPGEVVPDFTVVYSNGTRRLDRRGVSELKNKVQARQIEVLRKLIHSHPAKFQ